jgi:ABC-type transport system involved in cytochrome bd biosynthesis fused ATPase/permease subunit
MFKLSLRDNLTLGLKMSDADLLKLIDEIEVKEWYESLPKGLDTIIDINYIDLPDGVREKLNILRGIISNKETLLLDEPTYDLDMDSEKVIANMIKKYWKKKSYIIVTHRPIFTTICKKHYFMKNHELLESEPLL